MAFFNYVTKEITLKVVYYGPGLSGKTTNLQHLYSILDPSQKGKFISLSTESDRTLFFDFLPVDLGKIRDFSLRFQLYTVPGQIRYNATRRLVLKGADAVVFVADSQKEMREQNIESLNNMRENLVSNNIDPDSIPVVLQYNKRDLTNLLSIDELNSDLNKKGYPYLEAEALNGRGVKETFELITRLLLKDISKKHRVDITSPRETVTIKVPERERFEEKEEILREEGPQKRSEETPGRTEEIVEPVEEEGKVSYSIPDYREELEKIVDSLDRLTAATKGIKDDIPNALREFSVNITSELKDLKRQQGDMLKTLNELKKMMDGLKEKKRWFHF